MGGKESQTMHNYYTGLLLESEVGEIAAYTVQKINSYPKTFGKTVENYFHLLYPDEVKAYLMRNAINAQSSSGNHVEVRTNGKKQ
jgi:hypothetical protein